MRAALLAIAFLCAAPAVAQPLLEERLLLGNPRYLEPPAGPEFTPAPVAAPGFQTRIVRASIRDHLRDYRVRVLPDGLAVQKRFTIGR